MEQHKSEDVSDILRERGSKYGKFETQARTVGEIIYSLKTCAEENNNMLSEKQLGGIAYIAIKLARYANGETTDTLVDLEGYARLIKEMHNG